MDARDIVKVATATCSTPLGPVRLYGEARGLLAVVLPAQRCMEIEQRMVERLVRVGAAGVVLKEDPQLLAEALRQLEEYFTGRRWCFDLPLVLLGTPFQESVWRAVTEIPFGATWTYQQLAERIGRPEAVRAVGAALGANPIPIVVPCHRVIGARGALCGYAGGLAVKEWLLAHERAVSSRCVPLPPALDALEGAVQRASTTLSLDPLGVPEEPDEDETSEEATDVRPVGDSSGVCRGHTE